MRVFIYLLVFVTFIMTSCEAKTTSSPSSRGYLGTLPVLTREYKEDTTKEKTPPEIKPSKEFNSENELKPIPKNDPTFVNIIMKKEKTTQYVNDLLEFVPMLENLLVLIEKESNVQFFNAKVYYFNKNAEYFRDKYMNKSEAQYVSYKKLLELSTHAKSVALLRLEAQKYNPYLASGDPNYIYNPNNISKQLNYLKTEIEQTIVLLKDSE